MLSPAGSPRRDGVKRGFTLVEVMVATVLLATMIVSILGVLIGSYRVAAKARYADNARYVIKALADQFLTQGTTDTGGNVLPLFLPTQDAVTHNLTALGDGISWTNSDGFSGSPGPLDPSGRPYTYLVKLADTTGGVTVMASVTRQVQYVTAQYTGAPGNPTLINTMNVMSAGYMLVGTFTITYQFMGQQAPPLSITAVRAVP
jgi:prepilin-type N-terminal cleavage/methylation domain-containing protein